MHKNRIQLTLILLFLSIFTIACSTKEKVQVMPLTNEPTIKEIITSKDIDYDFLSDETYMEYMKNLGEYLTADNSSENIQYTIGNLDNDHIPELVVFNQRDPNITTDEGSLELYQFNGEKYVSIDKISMNYDHDNYQLVIGKISKDKSGLLLNNTVGAHSGLTYGFVLENGKLKSIFNENKTSLISVYPENEIKDIDEDGILEFSIYSIDPETTDTSLSGADKLTLWYKWDGEDSANLIDFNRHDSKEKFSNKEIFNTALELIDNDFSSALVYMKENKNQLSNENNSELLEKYINKLYLQSFDRDIQVQSLFDMYQYFESADFLFNKYMISIDTLNSLEYLNREKVLKDEEELKLHLIESLNLGYRLETGEGLYYYTVNHKSFLSEFRDNITKEYADYLNILALNSTEPFLKDGSLMISIESLEERILLVESFKKVYPYSEFIPKISEIYKSYVFTYFYGDVHNSNIEYNTFKYNESALKILETAMKKYEFTTFGDIIKEFVTGLKANNNILNDEIRGNLTRRIN